MTNFKRSIINASLILAISISAFSAELIAQESETNLKWNLAVGDVHTVIIKQDSLITTTVDARKRVINNQLTVTFDWRTTKVAADGTATITQTIAAVEMHVIDETIADTTVLNVKTVDLNTAKKERLTGVSASLMKQIQPLLNVDFEVEMSARGEILNVTIPAPTLAKLRNAPSSLQLRGLFSETGLKEMYGQAAMVLPEETLKIGGSWNASTPQNSPMGKYNRIHTYTYVGPQTVNEKQFEQFDLKTELKPVATDEKKPKDGAAEGMAQEAVPPELVEFTGEGKILLDSKAGFYKSSEMKNSLSSRQKYREKTIKTNVTTTVSMSIEKK